VNVSWRAAEGISIRKLAAVAGLPSARVHQLLAAVDLEALDVVAGQLSEVSDPLPRIPTPAVTRSRSRFRRKPLNVSASLFRLQ
jgi:hypothetical protein